MRKLLGFLHTEEVFLRCEEVWRAAKRSLSRRRRARCRPALRPAGLPVDRQAPGRQPRRAGGSHAGACAPRPRPANLRLVLLGAPREGRGGTGFAGAVRVFGSGRTRSAPARLCAPPPSHAHLPPPPLRSDRGKKHKTPEADLQVECVAWTEELGLTLYGTMGGVFFGGEYGARAARGRAFKARGTSPGIPDLLIFDRGARGEAGLAVELKIGDNPLSPEQER